MWVVDSAKMAEGEEESGHATKSLQNLFVLVGLSECKSQSARNALSTEQDTVEFCESYDRVMRTFGPQFGLFKGR